MYNANDPCVKKNVNCYDRSKLTTSDVQSCIYYMYVFTPSYGLIS